MEQLRGCTGESWCTFVLRPFLVNIQRNNRSSLPNAIVVSSAIPKDNVEILHAKTIGVPVYKRGHWLGKLTQHHNLIAVSGSHGKTTTASMLAYILNAMGDDLTAVVGAHVPQVIVTAMTLVDDKRKIYESINCMRLHLNNFMGISRRFEMVGTICGCHIYDDDAHHQTEICVVLQTARQRYPFATILVVFHPCTCCQRNKCMEHQWDGSSSFNNWPPIRIPALW